MGFGSMISWGCVVADDAHCALAPRNTSRHATAARFGPITRIITAVAAEACYSYLTKKPTNRITVGRAMLEASAKRPDSQGHLGPTNFSLCKGYLGSSESRRTE